MIELTLILLAGVGLTSIIVESTIFERYFKKPLWNYLYEKDLLDNFLTGNDNNKKLKKTSWFRRRLVEIDEMIGCYLCAGWWSSVFCAVIYLLSTCSRMNWLVIFLYGFAGSYLSMLAATLLIFFNKEKE